MILPIGGVVHFRAAPDVVKLRRMTELPITEKSSGGSCGCGGAFILVAPHNPLPLLAQIADLHGDAIQVSYVQEGPDAWKLKLERRS